MTMMKYGLGYKGTNSYNEMDGNGWETAENGEAPATGQSVPRLVGWLVGWTGGQKGKEGWSAGQARSTGQDGRVRSGRVPGEPAEATNWVLKREPESTGHNTAVKFRLWRQKLRVTRGRKVK
jgi:hypothetical protein